MKTYGPKRFPNGVIRYGELADLSELVTDAKSHYSPKEIYLPIVQTLLYFKDDECIESEVDDEELLIYARQCDIDAMSRLDAIFLKNGGQEDNYYKRLRDKVSFKLMECKEPFENCFCDDVKIDLPAFDSEKWKKYDDECISCGRCTAVCPTCSCFDTIDVVYNETSRDGERRRVWGSCMREDFTTMAGGHCVRKTPGERMRFKLYHKYSDFRERFGETDMCVGCGRCIDNCPKDISIREVAK